MRPIHQSVPTRRGLSVRCRSHTRKIVVCLALTLHLTTASVASGPPQPPGGGPPILPPPILWRIESPAHGAVFRNDAHLACSGSAATNGTTWELLVTAGTITSLVTGSSANSSWVGTVTPNSANGNWPVGNAKAELTVNSDIKDTKQFSFVFP
jgi:hypothetical protein